MKNNCPSLFIRQDFFFFLKITEVIFSHQLWLKNTHWHTYPTNAKACYFTSAVTSVMKGKIGEKHKLSNISLNSRKCANYFTGNRWTYRKQSFSELQKKKKNFASLFVRLLSFKIVCHSLNLGKGKATLPFLNKRK